MTAAIQMLMGAGAASGPISFSASLGDTRTSPANAQASIVFNAAGSVGLTGSASTSTSPNWYGSGTGAPTLFATFTQTSGTAPSSSSAANTPTSAAPSWVWTTTALGTQVAAGTVRLSTDAAGANVVATIPITVSITRT